MEDIYLIMVVGILNLLSFYLGFNVSNKKQKSTKNKEVTMNPITIYKKTKEKKKIEEDRQKEQEILKANLKNIENYDGTSLGQDDIP